MTEPLGKNELRILATDVLQAYDDSLNNWWHQGYEHMGDMWRDMLPLARGVLALLDDSEDAE